MSIVYDQNWQYLHRAGISSFSSLANKDEVADGLTTLQNDIEAGDLDAIVHKYDNDKGDYLFIIASNIN